MGSLVKKILGKLLLKTFTYVVNISVYILMYRSMLISWLGLITFC